MKTFWSGLLKAPDQCWNRIKLGPWSWSSFRTKSCCIITIISALMVEVFTDKALSLDNLLSYEPMHSAFEEFMKHEKSMGKSEYFFMSENLFFRCSVILFDELWLSRSLRSNERCWSSQLFAATLSKIGEFRIFRKCKNSNC